MEGAAEQVVDVSALGHGHQAGGALVQPVHRVEDEIRPPGIGQRPGHRGRVRQEVGDVGGHARGLVHDEQMLVLPDHGQGPRAGDRRLPLAAHVAALGADRVAGDEDAGGARRFAVDEDAALRPGEPGDGVGGEAEPLAQDAPNGEPRVLRRGAVADIGHGTAPFLRADYTTLPPERIARRGKVWYDSPVFSQRRRRVC